MNKNSNHTEAGFSFRATGIGSVPFMDVTQTCLHILKCLPEIPFWPQLVKRSHVEDMNIQLSEGLPLLKIGPKPISRQPIRADGLISLTMLGPPGVRATQP